MEIQILDDEAEYKGKLRPAQRHGSIYDVFASEPGYLKIAGNGTTK
jgi:hypothetical protein